MKCSKCGAELEEGAIFCGSCGAKVENEPAPVPNEPQPAPDTEAPIPMPPVEEIKEETPAPPAPPVQPVMPVQPMQAQQPPRPQPEERKEGQSVSLGVWLCRRLITFIPCVGPIIYIVMLFIWAFDKKYDDTSRNWARSELIYAAISLVISIILIVAVVSFISITGYGDFIEDSIENFGPNYPYTPYYGY